MSVPKSTVITTPAPAPFAAVATRPGTELLSLPFLSTVRTATVSSVMDFSALSQASSEAAAASAAASSANSARMTCFAMWLRTPRCRRSGPGGLANGVTVAPGAFGRA